VRIADLLAENRPFISLEFFPPKERSEWPAFFGTVERLRSTNPLFASVTYGAGGSTQGDTLEIVSRLSREHGLEAMAHLTCIGAYRGALVKFLDQLAEAGVDNVLALRGDMPRDAAPEFSACRTLLNASDLVAFIRQSHPGLGLGVAGYPETHPEAESPDRDLEYLKLKIDQGGDFIVTQLFFDNRLYYDFVDKARALGVTKPIIPGILPVVSLKVIQRIISLCGASIPPAFMAELEAAEARGGTAAVQATGIAYARRQAEELLAWGAPGVHLYTLNRAEAVLQIADGLLPD
jgi:methylenetetrahydrofolate reductase (NADPH)